FSYWEPATIDLLHWFGERMKEEDAPIVTMDAGPNVHVIVPRAKKAAWRARIEERFPRLEILEDLPGSGARVVEIS
ncbi:MAG: diphosphomevalonate decarboxylase, partial [Bdellovibrionota bacterium]